MLFQKKYALYIALFALTFAGCKRQEICAFESYSDMTSILFTIDWSESNVDESEINNVSIYAYANDGSSPYIKVSGNTTYAEINLPQGIYSILIFNDFAGDIAGVDFKDDTSYELFCAEIIKLLSTNDIYYNLQEDESIAQSIDKLAAWHMEEVEISSSMTTCSYCKESSELSSTLSFEAIPTAITTQCIIELSVENLDNAAYIEATIKGLASGAYLSTNDHFSLTSTILYCVELDNQTYSNDSDGIAYGEIDTFGKDPNTESVEVVLNIILNSGELVTYSRDVSAQIVAQDGAIIVIDLTLEGDKITLPASSDGGFGVEGWGNNEKIEL